MFASSCNVFHRLINYVKSFCANGNRAKLKIVGSSCNTAADFLVSVMGRNGRECLTTVSKNHDTYINCRYIVIFFIYKCMDIVRVFRRNVMFMEIFMNGVLNSCSFACVPRRHFMHLPLKKGMIG